MKAIQLYKFIEENAIEWIFADNKGTKDILIFPTIFNIKEFGKLLEKYDFTDSGIECTFMGGCFAFWMKDLCEYFGIELLEVFVKYEK